MVIKKPRNGLARIFKMNTMHGRITFPHYFPCVRIQNSDLTKNLFPLYKKCFNSFMINASDLLSSNFSRRLINGKLHNFLDYDGVIMSDSGGFSKFAHQYDQYQIFEAQIKLGVDIATTLDHPIILSKTWHDRFKIQRSVENAVIASELSKDTGLKLYASVHGRSTTEIINVIKYLERKGNFDGYAIGSLVPITSNIRYVINIILKIRESVPEKVLHIYGLTGYGLFLLLFYLGVNSVDSYGYLLYGVRRYYFIKGKGIIRLNQLPKNSVLACKCPVCKNKISGEIDHREMISFHNYYVLKKEILNVRKSIEQNHFRDYLVSRLKFFPTYLKEIKYIDKKLSFKGVT